MKLLNRFRLWVVRMVIGRSWFIVRNGFKSDTERNCFAIGYRTRKGKVFVVDHYFETNWDMQAEILRKGFRESDYSPEQIDKALADIKTTLPTKKQLLVKAKKKEKEKK